MSSRRLLVALAAVIPLSFSAVAHAQAGKIGYVNFQKALAELDEAKAARARLETLKEQKQKDLDKAQDALKKDKDTFDKQASTMTEQARNEKAEGLQKRFIDLQQNFEKGRAELAQKENEEFQPIVGKMRTIITSIAQKEGFQMVFDAGGIAYAPDSLDLTPQLVRTYNEQNKVKTPSTAPKAEAAPAKKK
ncbi:MAG TPA: OmpH family outer membrane protein [Myxococcaceae bacterium]|jgi:outer membrane protein|nr:OmpH family outer membrane protein [Myxococcaceae bacterium]